MKGIFYDTNDRNVGIDVNLCVIHLWSCFMSEYLCSMPTMLYFVSLIIYASIAFPSRLVSHLRKYLTSHNTHQSTEKSVSYDLTFSLTAKNLSRLAKIYSQFSIFKIHRLNT